MEGRIVGSSLPSELRLPADQLTLADEADVGDQHVATHVVAVAGSVAAVDDTDAEPATEPTMPVVMETATGIPAAATAGLDDGERTGGGCGRGERGGSGSNEYKLLHDTLPFDCPARDCAGRC